MVTKPGLNLKGMCWNLKCCAYQKKTWIKKGFGDFNIMQEILNCKCPDCEKNVPPEAIKALAFFKTKAKVEGEMSENKTKVTLDKEIKDTNGKGTFLKEFDENLDKWNSLQRKTFKLQ